MPDYRRPAVTGATIFFTVALIQGLKAASHAQDLKKDLVQVFE
mgnify:CR=1 FL=1